MRRLLSDLNELNASLIICATIAAVSAKGKKFLVFTARRVCIARTMPSQDVRPSVCHTSVLCLNGYTYPQFFFTVG